MMIPFDELYARARSVVNPRRLSEHAEAGGVGAAILAANGSVYAGVCIDTGSSMGFCAEHAAAAAMVTAGESRVLQMVAVGWDGRIMPPCGRCREFISQLHRDNLHAEVLVAPGVSVTLRELLPHLGDSGPEAVLVSACLLGEAVRYDGGDKRCDDEVLQRWLREGRVVPICPEVTGGLPVPRPPAEIAPAAGGAGVLAGTARVIDIAGRDVTVPFVKGAMEALARSRAWGIRVAVLKENSPSCGSSYTYDGTFSGTKVSAPGVTAALLREAGLQVFSEAQFDDAQRALLQSAAEGAVP